MEDRLLNFIQTNSPDGGFLQSEYWWKFQEAVGRKTYTLDISDENGELIAAANIFEHALPVVGKYFYIPRGIVVENFKFKISNLKSNPNDKIKKFINDLIGLAREKKAGWIRVEPNSEEELESIKDNLPDKYKIKKSSVDMQPREIFLVDISKSEEELIVGMKQKTRYNIRLSQRKGVRITCLPAGTAHNVERVTKKNIDEFLRLVKITSERDNIKSHPESYYRQMFEMIPPEILKLYVAEYEGKIIAANLVLFFGKTATYMHGASDNVHRDVMAPYLLQWRQILDAKASGCTRYDFGGVKVSHSTQHITHNTNNWEGITKFKTGFAPDTKPIEFPGCWDIVLKPRKYKLYRILRKARLS